MKTRSLSESFRCAVHGVVFVFRTERNMMLHFFAAVLVLVVAALIEVTLLEFLCLILTISLVLICEMINTALEILCDVICAGLEPRIKRIKDIAAGAVLISAVSAVLVGGAVFGPRIILQIKWIFRI
ncbi:MAG: diacylglycerol kinase family protein [Firmicutes bacterium]|nr:diacylglycerol kinase family protein [Bacillota bacterium]